MNKFCCHSSVQMPQPGAIIGIINILLHSIQIVLTFLLKNVRISMFATVQY